jgi:F-type H+-transporting ATPase subunit b
MEQPIDITWQATLQFILFANFSLINLSSLNRTSPFGFGDSQLGESYFDIPSAVALLKPWGNWSFGHANDLIYQIASEGPLSEGLGSTSLGMLISEGELQLHQAEDGAAHFGFNFDLIETNILNLAVVLGVVIFLGGDVLTSLLNDRKQKILGSLKTATEKFIDAEKQLEEAKQKIEIAKTKAIQIREQGKLTAIQTTQNLFLRTEEEIRNLDQSKQASLRFEEEKASNTLRQQVVSLAIQRVFNILGEALKLDGSLQTKLIETNIRSLSQL